jgi:hypothetical protein
MPLTNYALDSYVAQEMSQLTECNAKEISSHFTNTEYWISNFVLNSIFRVPVLPEHKPFIFTFIRKTEMALLEYEQGRLLLDAYVGKQSGRISAYFRCLYHFEITVNLLYQTYELVMKKMSIRLFAKGDGSPLERLNRIYNIIKHAEFSSIPETNIHPVWLRNDGIFASTSHLTFDELHKMLLETGRLAEKISNAKLPDQSY